MSLKRTLLKDLSLKMHKNLSKQVKTYSIAPRSPYTPLLQHIFTSLSIYFSPPLSLNLSWSHLQGSHPSFVLLLPFTSSCLCLQLCFLSTSAGGSCPQHFSPVSPLRCFTAPHIYPLHLHPIFPVHFFHVHLFFCLTFTISLLHIGCASIFIAF